MADTKDPIDSLTDSYNNLVASVTNLSAEGGQISGTKNLKAGDVRGVSIITSGDSHHPVYTDGTPVTMTLATMADINNLAAKLTKTA